MTRTEQILLQQMRYIASISTGQIKRIADAALDSVTALNSPLFTTPKARPQHCGTGYCSCIECHYKDWREA